MFIPQMLGFGDQGAGGYGSQAAPAGGQPTSPILNPIDLNQINQAYNQSQSGIGQQQAFLNALQSQGGIGNQANVFAQQQALANQLQGVANGTGPNPALQQLQNTTGQNVANQAALMAGQRGASANVGLMARQAAMQGANLQQQAVGQGAALQAQQQMAGMNALQGQQANMANLSTTQVGQQAAGLQGLNQASQSEQQALLGALGQQNNANVGMQSNINSANAGIAQGQMGMQSNALGSIAGIGGAALMAGALAPAAAAPAAAAFLAAKGGVVKAMPSYADGGQVTFQPQSYAARFLAGWPTSSMSGNEALPVSTETPNASSYNAIAGNQASPMNAVMQIGASALKERNKEGNSFDSFIGPEDYARGGSIQGEQLAAKGKMVPGKAAVKGDSYQNDTVPAMLSPGEVVIPRHVMQSNDPAANAAKFVAAILAKNGKGIRGKK